MATLETRLAALVAALGADFKLDTVPIVFSAQGALTTRTGKSFVRMLGSGLIVAVNGWIDTAPTGATTFKVDVNKNGSTIYGTQTNQPTWVAASNTPTVGAHSVTAYANGDRISVDIDAVGSTVAGSDLTVTLWTLRTA